MGSGAVDARGRTSGDRPPTADRRLAAAEVGVPGLGRALDPQAVGEAAHALLGLPVADVTAVYARLKPGTSVVATHRVRTTDGGEVLVAAKAHRAADADKLGKHLDLARHRHGPMAAADAGDGVLLRRWPADTALPATGSLDRARSTDGDPTGGAVRAPGWVRRALGVDVDLRPIRWKPARRMVMGLVDREGAVRGTLKVTTRAGRARQGAALLGLLAGHDAARSGVVLRWIPGTPLDQLLMDASDPAVAVGWGLQAGSALAALHAMAPPRSLRQIDPVPALVTATAGAGDLLPALAARIQALTDRTAPLLPRTGTVVLHGDASADQLVIDRDRARPIDADDVGVGDPAVDLGSLLAALDLDVQAGRVRADVSEALVEGVLEGYGTAGGRWDPASLAATHATGLLRRLGDPFKLRDPAWDDAAAALLDRAAAVLQGHGAAGVRAAS